MKAIVMHAPGAPQVLSLADVPTPQIAHDTDLLVRLKAAGVNPIDTKLRARGTYFPERMPAILGCDGAGVVEAVGAGVSRFKTGDAVYFCNGGIGGIPATTPSTRWWTSVLPHANRQAWTSTRPPPRPWCSSQPGKPCTTAPE